MAYDPRLIPRPAMFPMARPCTLTTRVGGSGTPVHGHKAYVAASGNGLTDFVAGHFHYVRDGKILPSQVDGHVHQRTNIPGGTGR